MNSLLTGCLQLLSPPDIADASHLGNRKLEGLEDAGDTWKDEGTQQPLLLKAAAPRIEMRFSGQAWQQVYTAAPKRMTGVAYKKSQHHLPDGIGGDAL